MNVITALVLSSFVAAPVPKADELQRARQSFQGEWKVLEFTRKGRAYERDEIAEWKVSVKGNIFAFTSDGRVEETTFTIDPKANPATINFTKADPIYRGEAMFGIYKQEGDKITICCAFGGEETPKEFKSPPNSKTCLFVLERVKK